MVHVENCGRAEAQVLACEKGAGAEILEMINAPVPRFETVMRKGALARPTNWFPNGAELFDRFICGIVARPERVTAALPEPEATVTAPERAPTTEGANDTETVQL